MPKTVEIEGIGPIHLYKRSDSRNIRLGFDSSGRVRITLPTWAPYTAGVKFAVSRSDWIEKHRPLRAELLKDKDRIGKAHTLRFSENPKLNAPRLRISMNEIIVSYPTNMTYAYPLVQAAAERGSKKALKVEGEKLLPQKLNQLALLHSFNYRTVVVKQLKSKWGSCNQFHDITLNYYLMQLPWSLIDYVLLHELVHTEHLNHSPEFWQRFEAVLPEAKKIRKQLKSHKTIVVTGPTFETD